MNKKFLVVLILLMPLGLLSYSQTQTTVHADSLQVISKQKSGDDQIKYVQSTYGYSVMIPKWWEIKETPSPNFFGGTFPKIDQSEGALLFKAFEKEKFKTLQNFENWVIEGYRSGDSPKWSNDHMVLFKKDLSEFADIGKAYKVQLKTNDVFYNSCYIIVETSQAFLWVDLTATRETYDANFKKLEKIMLEFTTL